MTYAFDYNWLLYITIMGALTVGVIVWTVIKAAGTFLMKGQKKED